MVGGEREEKASCVVGFGVGVKQKRFGAWEVGFQNHCFLGKSS